LVIEKLKLKENQVIIISNNYTPPQRLYEQFEGFQNINLSIYQKLSKFNVPKHFDAYISDITNNEYFIAYIDLMHNWQRLLVTHKNCKSFNFIEEGTASYSVATTMDAVTHINMNSKYRLGKVGIIKEAIKGSIQLLRGYPRRILQMPYYYGNYADVKDVYYYGLHESTFPGVKPNKKINLHIGLNSSKMKELSGAQILNDCVLWIEDSYYSWFNIPVENYKEVIEKSIKQLPDSTLSKNHYIKLRPSQKKENSAIIEILKKHTSSIYILPDNIIIESLLIVSKNLVVIGNVSSVLFYAAILNHKSISMFDLFKNRPDSAFEELDTYWRFVDKLSN
jgi:hypothetical protein